MKYIKVFNEVKNNFDISELKDFCENNLAYLLDYGVEIEVVEKPSGMKNFLLLSIKKFSLLSKWDEVKDYIIPFINRLNNKYIVEKQTNFLLKPGAKNYRASINDIINDNIKFDSEIGCLNIWLRISNGEIKK
jgi:hypothetical protein